MCLKDHIRVTHLVGPFVKARGGLRHLAAFSSLQLLSLSATILTPARDNQMESEVESRCDLARCDQAASSQDFMVIATKESQGLQGAGLHRMWGAIYCF